MNVVDVYEDNDISASVFATKAREDWPRMLDDIRSGKLQALIMWTASRGSRDLTDWSQFLDLIRKHNVPVHVVSHDRTYNPNNHRDWETLAMEGVKSASFSMELSANLRRGHASARKKGRPHGTPRFGWQRIYDEKSGKMLGQIPRPDERPFVEEAFAYVLAGGSMVDGARDWARRNDLPEDDPDRVPLTRGGKRWSYMVYRSMLLSPVHMGKFIDPKTGEMCEGNWDGFITEDTWWRVNNIIRSNQKPVGSRPAGAKYLLTFIARCDWCNCYMSSGGQRGVPMLVCSGLNDDRSVKSTAKHLSIRMDWVDKAVKYELAKLVSDRDYVTRLAAKDTDSARNARAEAAKLQAELDAMFEDVKHRRGKITAGQYAEIAAAWEPDIARLLEQATKGLDAGSALALELLQMAEASGVEGDDLHELMLEAIEDTELGGQRALVKMFTPSIRIRRAKRKGGRTLDPDRIVIG
jgi:DNA invertase Pin-like site-specific DNA recombinase